jgi:hypothetical protein
MGLAEPDLHERGNRVSAPEYYGRLESVATREFIPVICR